MVQYLVRRKKIVKIDGVAGCNIMNKITVGAVLAVSVGIIVVLFFF